MRLRTAIPALALLALAACNGGTPAVPTTLEYAMQVDSNKGTRATDLASAAARVMERRLAGLKQEVKDGDVSIRGNTIVLNAKDADTATALNDQLAAPFSIEIMLETDPSAAAGSGSDTYGGFTPVGIAKGQFDWVQVKDSATRGKTAAEITFTQEGQAALKEVFSKNPGKRIGIFLRGNLMSLKVIDASDAAKESILVDNIPDPELASIFADDVNVGLHVSFVKP